jgi:hypothetical protein
MVRDEGAAAEAADMGAVFADGDVREWPAPVDAAALARIEARRCKVRARMAEFAAVVREPQRREEALQLLLLIVHWVEGLYAAEDSLLPPGAHANAQRQAHRAVLRDLHASVARLVSPDGGYEEFDLAHAIDALLIHECVGGGGMRARQPAALRQAGNLTAIARGAPRPARPGFRQPVTH